MKNRTKVWPVYTGASFNIWEPDTDRYYDSVDSKEITDHLQAKRFRQHRNSRSAFAAFDEEIIADPATLPCLRPRIVYRDVTRSTDSRTAIAALIPGGVVVVDQAPYLLRIGGNERDEAFMLGLLSSMILDWYARCVVEQHIKFHILNNFRFDHRHRH